MEKRRLQRFSALPPVGKGLLSGAVVGCVLTVILHVLYLWLSFGGGDQGFGVLVGCAWSLFVNALTAALCGLLGVEWHLGPESKPSGVQFLLIFAVNTIACGLLGAAVGCVRQFIKGPGKGCKETGEP